MSVNLDSSAMQQLQAEQRALLDTIDQLRHLGEYIDLPQLIVVGDQSAGKSSVLEAISRVRFPMKDGVCTRFATELALRRSPQTQIKVNIRSDNLHAFSRSTFDKDDLPGIIEEAKQHMGISGDATGFSEDVLSIEIASPDAPQLTLVDLPGFFHNKTERQRISGVAVVDRLAEKYMRQENSIILAVISAENELAAQKVLGEAKRHDPNRDRTLGVITKPDKVEQQSNNERTYLRLAQNEEISHKLALGWHVLRNRAQKEMDSADAKRDEKENSFFQDGVWSAIVPQDRGIETLREKLSQILLGHIQRKLPSLIARIEEQIKTQQTRLSGLGDERTSTDDMKRYLINISSRFQRVAHDAIHGVYIDSFFGGLYPGVEIAYEDRRVKKLRALVRDLNCAFCFVLATKGSRRQIQWNTEKDANPGENLSAPHHLEPLIGLYAVSEQVKISIDDLMRELEKVASENQGVEFPGSSNDRVALALFRDHSAPWEAIANQHVDLVIHFTTSFVETLVVDIAGPDAKTADALIRGVVTPYFQKKQAALRAKVSELLQHYKHGSDPQPMHRIFLKSVERRQNERVAKQVTQIVKDSLELFKQDSKGGLDEKGITMRALQASSKAQSEFNTEQTIDNAMLYYNMSLRVFTDNVMTLALENCLISDIPNILSPDAVFSMTDDEVTKLAAESARIRKEREKLQLDLKKLQIALAACLEYKPRESSNIFAKLPNLSAAAHIPASPLEDPSWTVSGTSDSSGSKNHATLPLLEKDRPGKAAQGDESTSKGHGLFSHLAAAGPPEPEASKLNGLGGGLFAPRSPSTGGVDAKGSPPSGTSSTGDIVRVRSIFDTPKDVVSSSPSGHPSFSALQTESAPRSLFPDQPKTGAPLCSLSFGSPPVKQSAGAMSATPPVSTKSLFGGMKHESTAGAFSPFSSTTSSTGSSGEINGSRSGRLEQASHSQHAPGTQRVSFKPLLLEDIGGSCAYMNILFQHSLDKWSPEELRLADTSPWRI